MAIAELIKEADVAYENMTQNVTTKVVNDEVDDMGLQSAVKLGLNNNVEYYETQKRKKKLESYGYNEMSIEDISKELFGHVLPTINVKEKLTLRTGSFSWQTQDYGKKNGTTDIGLTLYRQPKLPHQTSGYVEHPDYTRYSFSIYDSYNRITKDSTPAQIEAYRLQMENRRKRDEEYQARKKMELIKYTGYCDKISFLFKPDIFSSRQTKGYISSPSCLNQPIPAELLARMETLARTGLINCFLAAGYEKAFTFETPVRVLPIDPIILAVIDNGFGMVSPMNPNTHMYFVGKYN